MAEPITDEDALISAARAGDTDAFLQLQRIHLPAVWDFAIRCTLDDGAATDVAREVFLRASRRLGELTANSQLRGLLYGLAVRQLAFREPADASAVGEHGRFHAWPVGAPDCYVDAEDAAAVWAAMRSYGADYKGLDLYVRRGMRSGDLAGALDSLLTEEAALSQEILWSLATVDAALGPIGDSELTAQQVFAGLKMVEPPHEVAAALWQELRSSFAPPPRGPRVLAVMGIAAIGVLATAGSLKAFTAEEPATVLGVQELRAVVRTTTTLAPDPSTTLAPGPPVRVTTTLAEVTTTAPATPGSPVTTTTRRTIAGPFLPPPVPTTSSPATPGDGGTGTSSSTTTPGTTVPGTTPNTTAPGSPSTSSTTTRPTTTLATTTTRPTTTLPPTTAPPTTVTPTTAPPTTAPPTTAPPTTAPPTTAPPTTLPPTTTAPPTTTTTEPPPTTTEPPVPVIR